MHALTKLNGAWKASPSRSLEVGRDSLQEGISETVKFLEKALYAQRNYEGGLLWLTIWRRKNWERWIVFEWYLVVTEEDIGEVRRYFVIF